VNGLKSLRRPEEVAQTRGKAVHEVLFPRKKTDEQAAAETPAETTETPTDAEVEDHADA
jgi:hypothetical protein